MSNAWDMIFKDEKFCTDLNPRRFVMENMNGILPSAGPVLDVGCGCGRHLVYLAANGYTVYGIDWSDVALASALENLSKFSLAATLTKSPMWEIPFEGVTFAAAMAINVLNHGTARQIARSVHAIAQRMATDGVFLVTLLTTNDYRTFGWEVDKRTYICDRGPEKGVLHTVFDEDTARALFQEKFALESLQVVTGKAALAGGEKVTQEFFNIRARRTGDAPDKKKK